jgi:ubiquinone/menaquinone biosynthesis C-methylase UbiE
MPMNLKRVLEPEVMDTPEEARDYNDMDHQAVNRALVDDLLDFAKRHDHLLGDVLDLGTGTALIPIELCKSDPHCRVMAIDMAVHMLDLARYNLQANGMAQRITLAQVDAKRMPYSDGMFTTVISNSIIHHIPNPQECFAELVRVTAPGGLIFVRDLLRPKDDETVRQLVEQYSGQENEHSQQMFEDSLRAALSLEEIRDLVARFNFDRQSVQQTTDRHWTWAIIK